MRKLALTVLSLLFLFSAALAQKITINGKVTDPNGNAIPFASITEKGTRNGTVSNESGVFILTVSSGAKLVVSASGFKTFEISPEASMTIMLSTADKELSEVVVTALGVRREKKALGYSVQEVKGENLTIAKSVDLSSSLVGKVAGVQIVGSPSSTFDNADILIRGVTGLGPQPPIFVVDGTITNQSAIIMDNVESASVLKGPAATALYGQRAANGAVVITTKKGNRRKYSGVEVNLGITFENLSILPKYQNQYAGGYSSSYTSMTSLGAGFMDAQGFYLFKYNPSIHPASWASFDGQRMLEYGADESWGPKMDGSPYRPYYSWYPGDEFGQLVPLNPMPDNVKNFFRTGRNLNNSISFTSGGEGHNFRLTYANQDRTLILHEGRRQQHQLGLNGSFDVGKHIVMSSDLIYTTNDTKGKPNEGYRLDGLNVTQNFNQWFQRQLDLEKMKQYRQPDGSLNSWNIGDPNNSSDPAVYTQPQYWDNPWWVLKENFPTQKHNRLIGNVGMNIKINRNLNVQSYVRMNSYSNENDQRVASGGLNLDAYSILQNQYREMNYESNVYYRNKFGVFSVDGMAGVNKRVEQYSQLSMATAGGLSSPDYFHIAASISRPDVSRSYQRKIVNSVYGKASVGFKDMIFVEATLRNDWSSALPVNENSYLYPSASTSFIFTELLKTSSVSNWLSYGKIRASYASVGSDLDPHQLDIAIANGSFYGTNPSVAIGDQFRGGGIRPALTKAWEVGTELRFFKRVGIDFTIYQNNNTDQILPVDVSSASGFTTAQINAGNIVSKGIELTLSGTPVQSSSFTWDISVNWAKNSNEVKELAPGITTYLYATNRYDTRLEHRVGGQWGTYYGRKWKTSTKGGTLILANGLPDYELNKEIGQVLPEWTGGVFNSVKYKGFDLTFSIDFQKGGLFYSETRNFNSGSGLSQETVGVNDKGNDWRDFPGSYTLAGGNTGNGGIRIPGQFADGTENNRYISARSYWYTARQRDASNVLLDASYIKLREVRLGYTIPASLVQKTKIAKSANVGVIVQNAWLIWATTKKYGVDPSELEVFYREGGQLSATRQIGLNLRVAF
ncbi:MAG TPA: SusC/RagA family TonB-linked outer membrane protein [Chitinophagaceae bacterium]|nr:SusC/RagA family TonB-linked outer membrane protein [Chitinophagaceae bacterium]